MAGPASRAGDLPRLGRIALDFVRGFRALRQVHPCVTVCGTVDEAFEAATLIQTGKIPDLPLILMVVDCWRPLLRFARESLLPEDSIGAYDLDRVFVTDSPEEAVACIVHCATQRFGIAPTGPARGIETRNHSERKLS